ncbi:MAG: FHA domain-containing protein [bacterium]
MTAREQADGPTGPLDEPTQPVETGESVASGSEEVVGAVGDGGACEDPDTTTWGAMAPPRIRPSEEDSGEIAPGAVDPLDPEATQLASSAEEPAPGSPEQSAARSLQSLWLERVEPSLGRGERIRLDGSLQRVRLGRAEDNDVRLYTASASREHAVIEVDAVGQWILSPLPGKTVRVDGEETGSPEALEAGMNLVMGRDHLRCVTEGLAEAEMAAATAADAFGKEDRSSPGAWLRARATTPLGGAVIAGVLLGLGLLLLAALRA